jgi:hypothetical protein
MKEVEHVISILEGVKTAVVKEDINKLNELSDQTIHTASITQDADNIAIAVIVYSLSKIIQRKKYQNYLGWENFTKSYTLAIENLILALKKNDEMKMKSSLENFRKAISKLSKDLKRYIQDVFRKAQINKASKIYEHGISMEQTARLLGITVWELANYAGQKGEITEQKEIRTISEKERIKLVMEMFQ